MEIKLPSIRRQCAGFDTKLIQRPIKSEAQDFQIMPKLFKNNQDTCVKGDFPYQIKFEAQNRDEEVKFVGLLENLELLS